MHLALNAVATFAPIDPLHCAAAPDHAPRALSPSVGSSSALSDASRTARLPAPRFAPSADAGKALASLVELAANPSAMFAAIETLSASSLRKASASLRELQHAARMAHLEGSIDKMKSGANLQLWSSLFSAAVTIAAATCQIVGAVKYDAAVDAAMQKATSTGEPPNSKAWTQAYEQAFRQSLTKLNEVAFSALPQASKAILEAADPMKHLASVRSIEKAQIDARAENDKRYEDDFREAAQAFRQLANQALGRMQKLLDLAHESRMTAIGRA